MVRLLVFVFVLACAQSAHALVVKLTWQDNSGVVSATNCPSVNIPLWEANKLYATGDYVAAALSGPWFRFTAPYQAGPTPPNWSTLTQVESVSCDQEEGFEVFMAVDGGPSEKVFTTATNVTTAIVSGPFPNQRGCFKIRAYNNNGASPFSAETCKSFDVTNQHVALTATWVDKPLLPQGIALLMDMDEGTGTVTLDRVTERDMLIVGATWVTGQKNKALQFTTNAPRVVTPLTEHLWEHTFMAWVRSTSTVGGIRILFEKKGASNVETEALYFTGSLLTFTRQTNGRWTAPTLPLNTWVHVAVAYNEGTYTLPPRIYYNGVEQPVTTVTAPTPPTDKKFITWNSDPYVIGARANGSNPFLGVIDDVRMFNRILTAEEIRTEMHR